MTKTERKIMKQLFKDTVAGLQTQGYRLKGGGTSFALLDKGNSVVKVFFHSYNLFYIMVRYSVTGIIAESKI